MEKQKVYCCVCRSEEAEFTSEFFNSPMCSEDCEDDLWEMYLDDVNGFNS